MASKDGFLYALSREDGALRWKFDLRRPAVSPPVVAGSWVCLQGYSGSTVAVDAGSGRRIWSANLGGSLQSVPVLHRSRIYLAAYSGPVYALRADEKL